MAITATLKINESDPITLGKMFSETTHNLNNIVPTGVVDIMNPSFILDYNTEVDYTQFNYISIGDPFNRSYFIDGFQIDIGKKIIIKCSIDVLETYHEEIRNSYAEIVRTCFSDYYAKYLPDNVLPIKADSQVENFEFDTTPFKTIDSINGNYILTVIGGGNSM